MTFIVSAMCSKRTFLFIKLMILMYSTHAARFFIERNIHIIAILQETKILIIVIFPPKIGAIHRTSSFPFNTF